MGQIKMYRKQRKLDFRETKPTVYQLRQLTYPVIKEKNLIKYIANSAALPVSTIQACVAAIAEGIAYFTINGHRVVFPDFGGFYLNVRTKVAQSAEDLSIDENLRTTRLAFVPVADLHDLIADTGTTIVQVEGDATPTE